MITNVIEIVKDVATLAKIIGELTANGTSLTTEQADAVHAVGLRQLERLDAIDPIKGDETP